MLAPGKGEADFDWELVSQLDGIAVYAKEIPGSPLLLLKGEATLDVPMGKVATVMDQVERQPQWVPYLLEAKQMKYVSFYERLIYTRSNSPWPVTDRDFLTRSTLEVDKKEKKITVKMVSVPGPGAPPQGNRIRGHLEKCLILLQSQAGGAKTYFSLEIQMDLKGWIPKWVVNRIQSRWPRKYIQGLRAQASKPEIKEHPKIRELFGE